MDGDVQFSPLVGLPPKLPPQHLPRPRLVARLLQSLLDKSVTVLQAPAGYGKTVLLAECLTYISSPTAYLRLEPDYREPSSLVRMSIHTQTPPDWAVSEPVAEMRDKPQSIIEGFEQFQSRASKAGAPFTLIVDDYPTTATEAFNRQVLFILENLPADWRVIISSRGQPELPIGRWLAQERIAIYTDKDLAFTGDETGQLALSILGRELDPREADLLQRDFAGWVLGIKLVTTACQSLSTLEFQQILEVERGLGWTIDEYFDSEVMQGVIVDAAEQDFVYQTSILPELAVEVCNRFLAVSDAGERLRSLERRGAFVTRLDTLGTVYEYQPTFRNFLQARLRRRQSANTVAALHLRAAETYENLSLWFRAIAHYLKGEAPDKAARVLATHGYDLLHRPIAEPVLPYLRASISHHPVQTVLVHLAALPPALVESNPALLLLRVRALRAQRAYERIPLLLSLASERVKQAGTALDEVRTAVECAWAFFREGRYREAVEQLNHGLPLAEHEPIVQAEVLLALSVNLYAGGDMAAGREAGEQALQMARTTPVHNTGLGLEMQIASHLAGMYCDAGEFDLALALADRACSISTDNKMGSLAEYLDNLYSAMRVRVECGDFEAAQTIAGQWQSLLDTTPDSVASRHQLSWLRSQIALVEREYSQVEAWLAGIPAPALIRVQLCLAQGQFEEALTLAEQELAEQRRDVEPLRHSIAQTWVGIVEHQRGQADRARQLLEDSVLFFRENGLLYWQAGAELHLADLLLSCGEPVLARQHLTGAFEYGAREAVMNFSFWYPPVIASACAEALIADIEPAYALELASRRLTPDEAPYFRPLLEHAVSDMLGLQRLLSSWEVTPPPSLRSTNGYNHVIQTLVAEGQLTPEGVNKLVEVYQLTPRQIEVFVCYINPNIRGEQRRVNQAIAEHLLLSEATVRDYISAILRKLGAAAKDRLQLRTWAVAENVIPG